MRMTDCERFFRNVSDRPVESPKIKILFLVTHVTKITAHIFGDR